jgi:hypothetical protein
VEAVDEFVTGLTKIRENAKTSLERAAATMKKQYDKGKLPAREYSVGDRVYLNAENLPTLRATKKLDSKYYGPFEILAKTGASAYRLRVPASWKVYNVFNEVLLKPYHAPVTPLQMKRETMQRKKREKDEETGDYEVEILLDSRVNRRGRGRLEYLVKWKNYPNEDATWEPTTNLENAKEAIADFHVAHPSAPRKLDHRNMSFQKYENLTEIDVRKTLFGWEDGKFAKDYMEKINKNWMKWKGTRNGLPESDDEKDGETFVRTQTLKGG